MWYSRNEAERLLDQVTLLRVVEPQERVTRHQPLERVDLVVGMKGVLLNEIHEPEGDRFHPPPVRILGLPDEPNDPGLASCLLKNLTQRRSLQPLSRIQLPFRKTPVVVARPVDHSDLDDISSLPLKNAARRKDK